MGRTVLYILIGVSVVGALAILLLTTPMDPTIPTDPQHIETPATTDTDSELLDVMDAEPITEEADAGVDEQIDSAVDEGPSPAPEVAGSIDGVIVSGEYAHEMTVAGVQIHWANDAQQLRVGLVSPGTGFVAIGFDPDRRMEGANFIIGSMHEGELTIRDDYGSESFAHVEDTSRGGVDDIIAADGNEWPDQTVIEFIIPLDSGDPMDKPLLPGHEYTVLVAYHSLQDSFSAKHTRQGSGLLKLDLPGY
ncbi:hypothetical protein IH601_09845 [Candidatus Bipolaricaulota bacterium]|nr:hypothetical protein [Candidatus Bipolaricaulota bacterium]TFH07409.1 MAG: hypothetical protein E4H08_09545 [Candidatus Atribacteria bacterium]